MKKRGFTLAEVMVAMALIGLIASLTIPTFVSGARNKANAAKLSATISTVESAFTNMIATEAVNDITETKFIRNFNSDEGNEAIAEYLKISRIGSTYNEFYDNNQPYSAITRENGDSGYGPEITVFYETKNGALIGIREENNLERDIDELHDNGGTCAEGWSILVIDVNAGAKPNVIGRDAFVFAIDYDGILHPYGSKNYAVLAERSDSNEFLWDAEEENDYACTDRYKRYGCTARLVENNYNVDF